MSQPKPATRPSGMVTESIGALRLQKILIGERQDPKYSDLTVCVQGTEFKCHRIVLAASSKFFEAMFNSNMEEKIKGRVTIGDISCSMFEELMRWMYVGGNVLTAENMFEVFAAADQLCMDDLLIETRDFMLANVNQRNCVQIYNYSEIHQWTELKSTAWNLMIENFDSLSTSDLQILSYGDLKKLIEDTKLNTRCEDVVIDKILRWVRLPLLSDKKHTFYGRPPKSAVGVGDEHPTETPVGSDEQPSKSTLGIEGCPPRFKYLSDLLMASRYLLVSSNCLWQVLSRDPLVKADSRCCAVLEEISRYHSRLDCHQDSYLSAAAHRDRSGRKDVIVAIKDGKLIYAVNVTLGVWKAKDIDAEERIEGIAYQGVNKSLYLFGENEVFCPYRGLVTSTIIKVVSLPIKDKLFENVRKYDHSERQSFIVLPVGEELVEISWKHCKKEVSIKTVRSITNHCDSFTELCTLSCVEQVVCVTNVGSTVVVIYKKIGADKRSIGCFDLNQRLWLDTADDLEEFGNTVAFKKGDDAFLVEGSGTLWKLSSQLDEPRITMTKILQLWNSSLQIFGAILVDSRLYVYKADKEGQVSDSQLLKDARLDGLFEDVAVQNGPVGGSNFLHAVVPSEMFD